MAVEAARAQHAEVTPCALPYRADSVIVNPTGLLSATTSTGSAAVLPNGAENVTTIPAASTTGLATVLRNTSPVVSAGRGGVALRSPGSGTGLASDAGALRVPVTTTPLGSGSGAPAWLTGVSVNSTPLPSSRICRSTPAFLSVMTSPLTVDNAVSVIAKPTGP